MERITRIPSPFLAIYDVRTDNIWSHIQVHMVLLVLVGRAVRLVLLSVSHGMRWCTRVYLLCVCNCM